MSLPSSAANSPILRILPALVWMGLIYLLSDQPTLPRVPSLSGQITSIVGHFGAYLVLAILLWWALGLTALPSRARFGAAFVAAVLFGVSDEWHQSFVPGRHPDVLDVLTDTIGAAAGLLAVYLALRSAGTRTLDVP